MRPHDRVGRLRLPQRTQLTVAVVLAWAFTTAIAPAAGAAPSAPPAPKPPPAAAAPPPKPVIARDFPDPDVLAVGSTYYAYSTASGYGTGVRHVPVTRASTLRGTWVDGGDAMPTLPDWVAKGNGGSVWAPDVSARSDGTYLLYFTARAAAPNNVQCIGAALAKSPTGPFRSAGNKPLVCRPEDVDSIDPKSFTDADGAQYLLYTSGRGKATIWAQRMSRDGLTPSGERRALITADRPEEANIVEAPTLVRRDGKYVLLYSGNAYNSGGYFVNYATANSLAGPFVKSPGALLTKTTFGGMTNPGGQDVVPGTKNDYLVFHAYARPGQRSMYVSGLRWEGAKPTLFQDVQARDPRAFSGGDQLPAGRPVPVQRRGAGNPG
ncbi:MAG: glycoside hydrolase family 43 protein [Pseudonocardia sp.]